MPKVGQWVKNLPEKHKTQVQSLNQEDPMEEGMATHSSVKNLPANAGDKGLIPDLGRSHMLWSN